MYEKLSNKIKHELIVRDPQEQLTTKMDEITLCRLNLLNTIKIYQPEIYISPDNFIKLLNQKCYNNQTRNALYQISNKICDVEYNLNVLKEVMNGIKVSKNSIVRGQKHMGLFNLGCICYINSTIQQLFMIEAFRHAIISITVPSLSPKEYFYQFQYIIYQLTYGRR